MKRIKLFLMCTLLAVSSVAFAQNMQVKGTVTDANGDGIPFASVQLQGTMTGASTDADGHYVITVPANGTLIFSSMGYKSASVAVGGKAVIDCALNQDTEYLDEVVVTALGITKSEKAIGYAATTVKSEEIAGARTTNVTNALAGKVAGVQIQSTSSDPGAASNVIIRGFSSVSGSNQPLYVVDGVPIQNTSVSSASGDKVTSIGGISNIAAGDIESMTILKGAAATALYGSRAANGVILVTTKTGKKGESKNFTISYDGGMQFRQVANTPVFQNSFGQGWNGFQTYIENGSWGPAFDGTMQPYGPIYNYQQMVGPYEAVPTNFKDFFDLGISHNHNVSFSGQSADNKVTYFASYSYNGDNGIMPGDHDTYKRHTIAFRGSYEATKWLKLSTSINFAKAQTDVVDSDQGATVIDGIYELPRNISLQYLKDLSSPFATPAAYLTPYGITNPYWALENNYDHTNSQQVNGKAQIDIKPIKQLTLTYRFGFDYTDYDQKVGFPQISEDDALMNDDMGYSPTNMNQSGWIYAAFGKKHELNHDFMANFHDKWGDFDFTAIVGVNINERYSNALAGQTSSLAKNTGFWDLSNGATKDAISESQSLRHLVGLFGDFTLGWKDELFLDVTLRNDWSSTLPIDANHFFYPGATLSWIFSNRFEKNNAFTFGKVRVAYGKTGNDAGVYMTNPSYVTSSINGYYYGGMLSFPMNSSSGFWLGATKPNSALRPEMTSEFEVGLDLKFFNGRLAFDGTYYSRKTSDQIFSLPVDPSTGFNYVVTNFGDVTNKGVELVLSGTPIQTKNWRWDISINWAKNKNKVVSMPDGLEGGKTTIGSFGAGNDAVYMYAEVGKPMGEIYTYLPKTTPEGNPVVDSYGQPLIDTEHLVDTGLNAQSDWTGGISTSLTFKSLTLSATLDVRKGGYMFSRTKNLMEFTGNGIVTDYNNRRPFIIPNSVVEVSEGVYAPNTTPIYYSDGGLQEYFDSYGAGQGGLFYMMDRSYAKLRNVSLTWELPKKWVSGIKFAGINVTAYCNNAFTWTASDNYYIDPETTSYAADGDVNAQFGELYSNPSCRVWGFSVGLKF